MLILKKTVLIITSNINFKGCGNFLDSLTLKTSLQPQVITQNKKKILIMSTSSTATASGRDPVPTDDSALKTQMCIFIVTHKDGTPFEVTSIMCDIGAHPPLGCAPIFCNRLSCFILHGGRNAAGITWCHKSNRVA